MSTTPSPHGPDAPGRPPERTATAGTLQIELWHVGREPEPWPDRGARQRYSYRVTDTAQQPSSQDDDNPERPTGAVAVGDDLRSGVGAPADPDEMLRSLVSFLSAAGEAYAHTMRNPATPSENLDLFPEWLNEAAYQNISELALLELDLDPDYEPVDDEAFEAAFMAATETPEPAPAWPPAAWYAVVFLDGDEGHQVVDLIQERGVDAALAYLSAWDYGTETRDTALFHGHIHDTPPRSVGSHEVVDGDVALVWHAGLGHVNLLCRFDPTQEPPAFWPGHVARLSSQTPRGVAMTPPPRNPETNRRDTPGL
ncbi:hypothetical protein [Myceligenerans crystallogenes]